jgi:DNA-binding transcriptional MerR regulator
MTDNADTETRQSKSAEAYRTISEVSDDLDVPQHVLRFWETKFTQIRPLKRAGGRRYYRPEDVRLLTRIRDLLYTEGYTIRGVQRLLKDKGVKAVVEGALADPDAPMEPDEPEQPALDTDTADAAPLLPMPGGNTPDAVASEPDAQALKSAPGETPDQPLGAPPLPPAPPIAATLSREQVQVLRLALKDMRGMAELLRDTPR